MEGTGGQAGAAKGSARPGRGPPRVLLVGYNGACNTGSETRLLSIIDDVRAVLGPDALVTVPTLNEVNLRRYLEQGPHLRIAPIPSIYFGALKRLVRQHDIVILVEGSSYMDSWTSALLWAFLWATKQAHAMGRPCMAYAVDAGSLKPGNAKRVRREASKTDLIVTRTGAAADRLRALGVTAPIEVTADTSFTYRPDPAEKGAFRRGWPDAPDRVVGIAPVDFHIWPVVVRPWGRREDCYRWPYYFSRSRARREASEALARGLAAEADRLVEERGVGIALLGMEALDAPIVRRVHALMRHGDRAFELLSQEQSASRMTWALRELDALVTSRYHAAVLAMAAEVPMVALGHDWRIRDLFTDLGLMETEFVEHCAVDACGELGGRVDALLADPAPMRSRVREGHTMHLARARRNRELLRAFVQDHGWEALA